jgi:hypothetical protein
LDDRYAVAGQDALDRVVMIKLNGGLGTSMGMDGPKSLLTVKEGLSFLDITVRQIQRLRKRHQVGLPLVLMNSFATHQKTLRALNGYEAFEQDIPFGFSATQGAENLSKNRWRRPLGHAVHRPRSGIRRDTAISTLPSPPAAFWTNCSPPATNMPLSATRTIWGQCLTCPFLAILQRNVCPS